MANAKPKTNIKRKAPVRVSKKKRGISKLQALAVAAVLALVGVVVVVTSQASGTRDYQYSWNQYCVSAYGNDSPNKVGACKNKSAEAMVYRLYRGLYGRNPDDGGYQFWTQKLAGDRTKVTDLSLTVEQSKKMGSDTAFVKALYSNMLMRAATQKEVDQWVGRLKAAGDKRWSRQKVVAQFAASGEAITKNQARWTTFVAQAPTVKVVQTAAQAQRKRFDAMLLDYSAPAKTNMQTASSLASQAQNQLTAATAIASKKTPSRDDLKNIAKQEAAAKGYLARAKTAANSASSRASTAGRVLADAQALASFSPDIAANKLYGISKIKARHDAVKVYAATANNKPKDIQNIIAKIADKYKVAEKKYEAEQARLALIAAANAKKAADDAAARLRDQWAALDKAARDANCKKLSYSAYVDAISSNGQYTPRYRDVILYAGEKQCLARSTAPYPVDFEGGQKPNYPIAARR